MFSSLISGLLLVATGLAGTIGAICALGLAALAILNVWGILDPRAGAQVKTGLIKLLISAVLAGMVTGAAAIATQLGAPG